jgi:amino acid adenylation domain-containing protein
MSTVVELLQNRAQSLPGGHAYYFLHDSDDDAPPLTVTYRDLDRAARTVAAALVDRGAAGTPVLLLYPPGYDYVVGFLGCLYAGAIAVPAYPPDLGRWHRTLPRLRALITDSGATIALGPAHLLTLAPDMAGHAPELAELDWLATDTPPATSADKWSPPAIDPGSIALLQYTSGSTATPRGVLLSHANLWHNAGLVQAGFGTTSDTVGVSWLPPYHDMGLIGGILQPLYGGFPVAVMSPLAFLRHPMRWLRAISRFGATMSGAPTFAYDLVVRRSTPQQRAALDLSRWQVAFCGAEPVRADTIDQFTEAFAPAGFRRDAFYPCYGLAEATLIVTGTQPPRTIAGRVSCGRPLGDQRLVIADPHTSSPRPPGVEGEIWLSGPSVAQGYWRRPDETTRTFGALLAGDPHRRYLRTGDLGYLDAAGELVVTGRIKDLIILRGRNVHPQDLEQAIERQVPGVRPGGTAAFPATASDEERVGVACEFTDPTTTTAASTVAAIRRVVADTAQVPVSTVVLLRRGQLPRTSSGKIQRHECRRATADGDWRPGASGVLTRWDDVPHGSGMDTPGSPTADPSCVDGTADELVATVAQVLAARPGDVPTDQPLTGLGLDSLRAIELQGALHTRLRITVTLSELFDGITIADLAARTPEPSHAGNSEDAAAPTPREATEGQRALWLIDRWAPGNSAYQISRAVRIRTAVDVEALDRALRELAVRHPALRSSLPAPDGDPVPLVRSQPWPALARYAVTDLDEPTLRDRVQAEADRPFDLASGPLWRVALFTRGPADHVLVLSLHHVITDFWSLSVMVDELLASYQGRAREHPEVTAGHSGCTPGPRRPDQEQIAARLRYWREALAGAPAALALPTSYPRPRVQSLRGSTHRFRLEPATLRGLDEIASAAGGTRFAVLAAGMAVLLSRHTGDDDLVLGAPSAGRDGTSHHQVGYFVNPVPLRIRTDPEASFRSLTGQVSRTVLAALDHAVPFPTLVEALRPARDPSRPPVFQAMLVLQRPPAGRTDLGTFAVGDDTTELTLGGLTVAPYPLVERGAAYDLTLTLAEVGGGLTGVLTFCADVFDGETMARLARHLVRILQQVAADPDVLVGALELTGAQERVTVLDLGRGECTPLPDRPLHELFSRRAARQPDATAVVAGSDRVTYRQLDQRSSALADGVRRVYGVRRGDLVAVHLPRGTAPVLAFWAALKTGGVYLPLAPDLPAGRLARLLRDARPAVVLTCRSLAGQLPPDSPPRVCLDEPWPAGNGPTPTRAEPARAEPGSGVGPDDPAYVLYTSGSTGDPKAALVIHRAAANLAGVFGTGLDVTPASRFLQFASSAYDVHVADIATAHLHGAALHIPPPAATVPGQHLVEVLTSQEITHAILSPSVLAAMPEAPLPALTHILCGGESLPPETVVRWARRRRLVNGYGPAEATVCATWWSCDPGDDRRPPLGRPVANVRVYVLDARMRPVPVGVSGEIYIGGAGVGLGYLHRPDLTATSFVPDPFDPRPGGRLYRTGDRGRWRGDGTLDFLGRLDDQIKIRGVRVEPGEVEARIRELPAIRQVAVVPRTGATGDVELVAYLVTAGDSQPVSELRERLRGELTDHALPAAFVRLDALPLNRSGKLDRAALPAPTPADRGQTAPTAPRTALERTVADVWGAALGHPTVGVRDHFFDHLGGTSLQVARVMSDLAGRLGRELPVTLIFEHPTVESLARRLSGTAPEAPEGPTPEAQATRRRHALARRTAGTSGTGPEEAR